MCCRLLDLSRYTHAETRERGMNLEKGSEYAKKRGKVLKILRSVET